MTNSYRFFQNKECEYFPCHRRKTRKSLIVCSAIARCIVKISALEIDLFFECEGQK